MKLSNPWPKGYTINAGSPYGWRRHPITGRRKFHQGVDVAGSFPVTVAGDGVVRHIGYSSRGGGHVVLIDHGEYVSVYYHGAEKTGLRKKRRVSVGDFIYPSGTTGASTGTHLHLELRRAGGRWGNTVDPVPFLGGLVSAPVLKVDGRLGRGTWREIQRALKAKGMFAGRIDGRPGPITYRALQTWANANPDGIIGPMTRRAVQAELGVKADGKWGRITISAMQRALNDGTF